MDARAARSVLLRSAAFRLAVLQGILFAMIVVALFGVTWWSVGEYVEQRVRATAADKLRGALHLLDTTRPDAVDGDALDLDSGQYFGLFDPHGNYIAGEIPVLPAGESSVRMRLRTRLLGPRSVYVTQGMLLDGRHLAVGVDRVRADALMDRVRKAFMLAGLSGLLAALVAGFLTARKYLSRVELIAAAASRIVDGRLDTRLEVSRRDDEIDRLSAALNVTWQRNQALLEGMRQLSTDIAHELRTPLAHLRFRLEETCASIDAGNPVRPAVVRCIDDVDRVLAIFGGLLRIAQIQSRHRRAGFGVLDLSLLASGVVADYLPLFEDEGRVLRAQIDERVSIIGDATLLQQLLVNLIENALRHTPRTAVVTVQVRRTAETVELAVADNGPGIPDSHREWVLQRLARLEVARATFGTGLGLALVKAITDLHEVPLDLLDEQPGLRVRIRFPPALKVMLPQPSAQRAAVPH